MTVRADQHDPLPPERAARWAGFGHWERTYFPQHLGLVVEEIRQDYCRMRLVYRPELEQPAGVVHGGAIASLIDSVVVPAVGWDYDPETRFFTVGLAVQYLAPLIQEDAVAEGWIVRRGRSIVFCAAEVDGVARGQLTYMVAT
jgi:uncharacterized protein (TIGR00369 family)